MSEQNHELTLSPQPIADGWSADCKCGWHLFANNIGIDPDGKWFAVDRDEVIKTLRERYQAHLREDGT